MNNSEIIEGKMKYIIIILLSILSVICMFSCAKETDRTGFLRKNVKVNNIVEYDIESETIEFEVDLDKEEYSSLIGGRIISDSDAFDAAIAILNHRQENGKLSDYELVSITHSTDNDLWKFEYSKNHIDTPDIDKVDGGSYFVVVEGSQGQLIKSWIEE